MDLSSADRVKARELAPSQVIFTQTVTAARVPAFKNFLDLKAVKIQSLCRRFIVRKSCALQAKRDEQEQSLRLERKAHAASSITKYWRAYSARRELKGASLKVIAHLTKQLIAKQELEERRTLRVIRGVTTINNLAKCLDAKNELAELRREAQLNSAITALQCVWRSVLATGQLISAQDAEYDRLAAILATTKEFKLNAIRGAKKSSKLLSAQKIMLARLFSTGLPFHYITIGLLSSSVVYLFAQAKKASLSYKDFCEITNTCITRELPTKADAKGLARFILDRHIDLRNAKGAAVKTEVEESLEATNLLLERVSGCVSHLIALSTRDIPDALEQYPVVMAAYRSRKKVGAQMSPRYPAITKWRTLGKTYQREITQALSAYQKRLTLSPGEQKGIMTKTLDELVAFRKMIIPRSQCSRVVEARCTMWKEDLQPGGLYEKILPAVAKAMIKCGSYAAFSKEWVEIYTNKATHPLGKLISEELRKLPSYHLSIIATLFTRCEQAALVANFEVELRSNTHLERIISEAVRAGCLSSWSRIAPLTKVLMKLSDYERTDINGYIFAKDPNALSKCLHTFTSNTPPTNECELVEHYRDPNSPYVIFVDTFLDHHRSFIQSARIASSMYAIVNHALNCLFREKSRLQTLLQSL